MQTTSVCPSKLYTTCHLHSLCSSPQSVFPSLPSFYTPGPSHRITFVIDTVDTSSSSSSTVHNSSLMQSTQKSVYCKHSTQHSPASMSIQKSLHIYKAAVRFRGANTSLSCSHGTYAITVPYVVWSISPFLFSYYICYNCALYSMEHLSLNVDLLRCSSEHTKACRQRSAGPSKGVQNAVN